jgi:hypothetical protein
MPKTTIHAFYSRSDVNQIIRNKYFDALSVFQGFIDGRCHNIYFLKALLSLLKVVKK